MIPRGLAVVGLCAALAYVAYEQRADDEALRQLAEEAACGRRACQLERVKKKRELFGWTFTFNRYATTNHRVEISCQRPFWVAGAYRCQSVHENTMVDRRF